VPAGAGAGAGVPAPAPAPSSNDGWSVKPPGPTSLRAHSEKAHLKRAPGPYEPDEVVLAHRTYGTDRPTPSWAFGTVVSVDGDKATMKFFSDDKTEQVPTKLMKAFDWQPKTRLRCNSAGLASGYGQPAEFVEATDEEHVKVSIFVYKDEREEKTVPVVACSQEPFWHDTLSPLFTERDKYAKLKAPPKSVSAEPPTGQVTGSLSSWLSNADGGSYIKIQKCYVTGKWDDLGVGGKHTGRRAATACAVGVPAAKDPKALEACLVLHGACEQKYLGGGRYAGCVYQASEDQPETIDCHLVK
jgi:hypothetical protein